MRQGASGKFFAHGVCEELAGDALSLKIIAGVAAWVFLVNIIDMLWRVFACAGVVSGVYC